MRFGFLRHPNFKAAAVGIRRSGQSPKYSRWEREVQVYNGCDCATRNH